MSRFCGTTIISGESKLNLERALIGVVHLEPLPGNSYDRVQLRSVAAKAVSEAKIYQDNGFHGIIVENASDRPFFPDRVPRIVVSSMSVIASAVRDSVSLGLGIAVLRNDSCSAIDIAAAVEADFIRVNVLCGSSLTSQGMIHGQAHNVVRHRDRYAPDTKIFADVAVKYSRPLTYADCIADEIRDVAAIADALIVSGAATGKQTEMSHLREVANLSSKPVIVGSGVDKHDCLDCLKYADALIVGSSLKDTGNWRGELDPKKVREFAEASRITD